MKNQSHSLSVDGASHDGSKWLDDDGRPKRTGNVWTASAHIITAVIGSGVLSLAWATAQLGWIAGPAVMGAFSVVTYFTSNLLSFCYRYGDPVNGMRNYTYVDAVRSCLGSGYVKVCGYVQYVNLFGVAIGYTIASSISMMAVKRSNCFHASGGMNPCKMNANPYMVAFGIVEIIFCQIPDIDQLWWVSIVAAVMSVTYSSIGLGLGIAQVAQNGSFKGTLAGVSIGPGITEAQKIWRCFQALGDIAFAYSYSIILIEIQDTVKSPPAEYKTMNKATLISVTVTSIFYIMCGSFGYAAFGNDAPGNLLTGFGFYNPFWLIDIANVAIVIHLVGAYQVFSQPIFAFIEKTATSKYPNSKFIKKEIKIPLPFSYQYRLNIFRTVYRTIYVIISTVISMLLPFFNDIVGLFGAISFWPLTVYFPVEMYIAQKQIPKWSTRWVGFQALSMGCLVITGAAAVGSIAGIIVDAKNIKPFHIDY